MRFLLLNQCFYPDVVSTAQHLTDLATELSSQGHEVTVVASDRGYDNPANRFSRRELWKGIKIIRIPSLSFGKRTKFRRVLNFASFLTICSLRLLVLPRYDVVVALTSPPLISFLASLFVSIKGGRFCFWVMDLNPDEAIAAGWLKNDSLTARLLKQMLIHGLKRADRTVVLDRFMRDRLMRKGIDLERISVLPPWSHDDAVSYSPEGRREFRSAHGLNDKFVVMYSGNHSPCHPLDTLLEAALRLASRPEFAFCFVGGGSEQTKVREFAQRHSLDNVICLPYEPMDKLAGSLSAADLQVVVMGDAFVGIVHPCKIYNIMSIGLPTLYIGPQQSHIADLAETLEPRQLLMTRHGDVFGVVQQIFEVAEEPPRLKAGEERFSKAILLPQMIKMISSDSADISISEAAISTSAQ